MSHPHLTSVLPLFLTSHASYAYPLFQDAIPLPFLLHDHSISSRLLLAQLPILNEGLTLRFLFSEEVQASYSLSDIPSAINLYFFLYISSIRS